MLASNQAVKAAQGVVYMSLLPTLPRGHVDSCLQFTGHRRRVDTPDNFAPEQVTVYSEAFLLLSDLGQDYCGEELWDRIATAGEA